MATLNLYLRHLWYDYKSELFFGFFLIVLVMLSQWLARLIPIDIFESFVTPAICVSFATVCFFGAWLNYLHSEGIRLRRWWANMLVVWGIMELFLAWTTVGYGSPIFHVGTKALNSVSMVVSCFFGWLLFIYPTEAIRPGWLNWPRTITQLSPLVILGVMDYYLPYDFRLLLGLYPACLGIILGIHLHKYRQWCEENYSSLDETDAQWIVRYLVMLIIAGGSYYYICASHEPTRGITQQLFLLFMLTYSTEHILFRPDPWKLIRSNAPEGEQVCADMTAEEKAEEGEKPTLSSSVYRAKLDAWMENEKPYLMPDFQLLDLRQILPLNRTYLSQLINTEYDCNFYQFVNNYRVEEAKRLMREYPEMKIQEVSDKCGFSSPTVFARNFAREMGMSPRDWSNQVNNS
ncbi:MAG: helix-turn-helix domain-containing protein [Paludibacteraceae bacterium]|nr:helix-turn-helix domain-containing protein [Paludibacteraceae bacterium]